MDTTVVEEKPKLLRGGCMHLNSTLKFTAVTAAGLKD
jgi:hypothetical protein